MLILNCTVGIVRGSGTRQGCGTRDFGIVNKINKIFFFFFEIKVRIRPVAMAKKRNKIQLVLVLKSQPYSEHL